MISMRFDHQQTTRALGYAQFLTIFSPAIYSRSTVYFSLFTAHYV